ncbi:phosphoribosylglycinamide formyltransferase [Neobacillus terrae]|uniref:phosphoribosylglycinamide formyltransferase n=1 Tax=Neobacillus terrae TaxID=3034837 RepID=UPI0014082D56|nr:phosphoribosylglycinamide formyltransferase [Neobacillus terrae]NHM29509.1 phosphoribosylglycinamide formyltransferase [Neobacillus terrae]
MKKIAVFASGSGSNFQAIADAVVSGKLQAELKLLVCDRPGAQVINRAQKLGIDQFVFLSKNYSNKEEFEREILKQLREREIDFLILAGYMRLIGPTLLSEYPERIINIHPSLLPAFPGKDAIGQALEAGASRSGVTIHFVDEGMDTGPVIAQQTIEIGYNETRESLQEKIHSLEHQLYPVTLQKLLTSI